MRRYFSNFFKRLACYFLIMCTVILSMIIFFDNMIPQNFHVMEGEDFSLPQMSAVSANGVLNYDKVSLANKSEGASEVITLKLFNLIPIKKAHVSVIKDPSLTAGGTPFGIKLFTRGVMVIDISTLKSTDGTVCPAKLAGIEIGDMILSLDNIEISSNEQVANLMEKSGGKPIQAVVSRNNQTFKTTLIPVRSDVDGKYKSGIWVRDSSAGIGTITYYLKSNLQFAGLGHGICDTDTGKIMPLSSGEVCEVSINSILKGHAGTPGELRGSFTSNEINGQLQLNCEAGIFGVLRNAPNNFHQIPLRLKQDIKAGKATILCTLDNSAPKEYSIMIDKIDLNPKTMTRNMAITVTDPELLAKTGGIIQGMSGSPILQDGELVGAVTHVFVNNPQKGYGIFAENMLNFSDELRGN